MRSQFTIFRSGCGPIRPSSGTRTLRLPHVGYADIIYVSGRSFDMHWEYVSQFFWVFFYRRLRHEASRLFTISSLCFRANISGLFWSLWTGFCTYIVNNELFKRLVDGMKEGCCVWSTELFIFIVSHAEQLHRNILFSAIRAKKTWIFSACKLGRCCSRHTRTLSHTSYIVLWLDFRAGRGDAALGRVLGVLFHQLQTGRLGDAAGHPGTTNTLREREKGRKK